MHVGDDFSDLFLVEFVTARLKHHVDCFLSECILHIYIVCLIWLLNFEVSHREEIHIASMAFFII